MMNQQNSNNQWAIILGGSSGLGLATAQKLALHGFNICIVHRDRKSVLPTIEASFEQIRTLPVQFVSFNMDALRTDKRAQIIQLLKEDFGGIGQVKVLVHSLAKGNLKPMYAPKGSMLQSDDFQLTIQAMAISLYDWVKDLFEEKMFTADARVISFTSEGNQKAWANYAAVSAAKAALEAITRNIALEFAPQGIRANCIQAGMTDTPSFRRIPNSEKLKEFALLRNPFGRLTRPEDIANVVYLLCQPEAAWINGAVIPVDGGASNS